MEQTKRGGAGNAAWREAIELFEAVQPERPDDLEMSQRYAKRSSGWVGGHLVSRESMDSLAVDEYFEVTLTGGYWPREERDDFEPDHAWGEGEI